MITSASSVQKPHPVVLVHLQVKNDRRVDLWIWIWIYGSMDLYGSVDLWVRGSVGMCVCESVNLCVRGYVCH